MATTTACAPKLRADRVDQRRVGERGGVDADLVRARIENAGGIVARAHAAADGEGNKELARRAPDRIEQRLAALVRGRDVEQHDLVRACRGVASGQLRRIARIDAGRQTERLSPRGRRGRRDRR